MEELKQQVNITPIEPIGGGKFNSIKLYKELKEVLRRDRSRYPQNNMVGFKAGYPIIVLLRVCEWLGNKNNVFAKLLLKLLKLYYFVHRVWVGVDIMIGTSIGAGIKFPHPVGVVISRKTIIGQNCTIHQHVTLGFNPIGNRIGNPIIGDNVVIFAGACICGNIKIGNNCIIAANAVVTKDVPDNCIVAGVPAKILSEDAYNYLGNEGRKFFQIPS